MKREGHDVVGVTLKLWSGPNGEAPTAGCCTLSDAEDARRVAAQLDIPYYVLDYTEEFRHGVVDRFARDYGSGRTPNPCIECNRTVKFDHLLVRLEDFDTEVLVTGHHARNHMMDGSWRLLRGHDRAKDQSYVLSMLTQDELSRVRLPVGELTKDEVRSLAGDLRYRGFLRDTAPEVFEPGPVVGTDGVELGRHDGIAGFTIGQRRGLGVAVGEPRYVVRIDPGTSTVVLGRREELAVAGVRVEHLIWADRSPVSGRVMAQFRAHGEPVEATLQRDRLLFAEPQEAVAPGQTIAFYDADMVLGGALIAETFV
jgi:tRNA-specific 2-thiouridylase